MNRFFINNALSGDQRALARCISYIENQAEGFEDMLEDLPLTSVPVTGITGPPGAGKSTITDQLVGIMISEGKKVAVLCIDPSSPFHMGALLGDRIRMSRWFNTPSVFIRSLAGKDSSGGLSPMIIEITDLLKAMHFDHIIIETIGVGQNEIDIVGLADTTVVVLVPEGGDEIQTMKAGLMEVADIFAVNKTDRAGADIFIKHLREMLAPAFSSKKQEVKILKMIASKNEGIDALYESIKQNLLNAEVKDKAGTLAAKAFLLISKKRMYGISREKISSDISILLKKRIFNLYKYVRSF